MQDAAAQPLTGIVGRFMDYVPTLLAGALVLAVGVVLGWIAKRAVMRILIWLRLDRLAGRVGWRSALGKGDVRAAVYELVGDAAMVVVVLVFLDNALTIWGLAVLSRLIDSVVFALPRLGLAALIVAAGLAVSNLLAERAQSALEEEELAHPRLLAKALKGTLLAVVVALALWALNFAREIVLSGFVIAFGAMGVAFALAVGIGSAKAVQRGWEGVIEGEERPAKKRD
jgi:Mechanosensitive ion channel, conserved TM helix